LGLEASDESAAGKVLSHSVRKLMQQINLPLSLRQAGIPIDLFQSEREAICDLVEMDLGLVSSRRFPYREDIRRLLEYAYEGITVDF
jgi:alcohol dehydrogenase class IV